METQDATEQLFATLSTYSRSGRIYQLIDPACSPHRRLTSEEQDACAQLAHPFLSQPRHQRLYLQPLSKDTRRLREAIAQERAALPEKRTEHMAFCGWILSESVPYALGSYMEKQLTVTSSEGSTAMLRYYDPRVLERLESILEPSQMSCLLAPIDHWFYFDHRKQLRHLSPPPGPRRFAKLALSPEQWAAIKRIGQVNLYWDKWEQLKREQKPDITLEHIDALVATSLRVGLKDDKDSYFFVMHGLLTKQRFHEHPLIQNILSRVTPSDSYASLTDELSNCDWERIREEAGKWPQ